MDPAVEPVECNGRSNHVHLLVNTPHRCLVAATAGVPELVQHYRWARRLWSGSYFAGSVGGAPIAVRRQYIEQQDRPV